MRNSHDHSTDHLDDAELLAKELKQRSEFEHLEREEPHLRDTTYGPFRGSQRLLEAWERWWDTNVAARARGIVSRRIGR